MNRLIRVRQAWIGYNNQPAWQAVRYAPVDPPDWDTLLAYYQSNGLYSNLQMGMKQLGYWQESLRPIRNPANAAVEFYAATLWPGALPAALPLVTNNARIVEPIHQVWAWSNLAAQKQTAARWLALYGNLFIRVAQSDDKVFLQFLPIETVTDWELDARGYLTALRIDTPQESDDGEGYLLTEIWSKEQYRAWKHQRGAGAGEEEMGPPADERALSEFGIDFIPVVHCKLRDVGGERGVGCFEHALDPIDECNRQATRLHQMLFRHNKNTWALAANGTDPTGRPLPPPSLAGLSADTVNTSALELGDDHVIRLPGNASLTSLVPQLNYDAALKILEAQVEYVKRFYLPELAWYDVSANANASGVALRRMLTAAIARCEEARGNAEAALARADMMALSIGQAAGVFQGLLGDYAAGDLEHSFSPRDVVPADWLEQAQGAQAWAQAGVPTATAARWAGRSEDEIALMQGDAQAQAEADQANLAQAVTRAQRNFDSGQD